MAQIEKEKASTRFFKDGDVMAIETEACSEEEFLRQASAAFASLIDSGRFEHDWEFQFERWLPQICEIVCKFKGYKADVMVRHVIVAGEVFPGDRPAVCVSIGRNGLPMIETENSETAMEPAPERSET